MEAAVDPLPFDASAAGAIGRLAAGLRRGGRQVRPRALDVIIAAVAVANEFSLYTCNPSDLVGLDGLVVVPVPHPTTS